MTSLLKVNFQYSDARRETRLFTFLPFLCPKLFCQVRPHGVVYFQSAILSALLIVYQKEDLVKQPMKSRDVLPKNVPGVGWVIQGWGGVCHAGVGWVIQGWGGVCHAGWGESYRGGVGYVMQGWGGSHRGGMIHTEHYHHLHTIQCGNYLELLRDPNSIVTTHLITYNHCGSTNSITTTN